MANLLQKIIGLAIFGIVVYGLLVIGLLLLPFILAFIAIAFVWYAIKLHQLRKALHEGLSEYESTQFSGLNRPTEPEGDEMGETIEVDYVEISDSNAEVDEKK